MEHRIGRLEKRVSQVESSLSTAIQALTGVLQSREQGHRQRAEPVASTATLTAPEPEPAAEVAELRRENHHLNTRVRTLEGYVASMLSYVEDQRRAAARTPAGQVPGQQRLTSDTSDTATAGESPVLQERIEHTRASPAQGAGPAAAPLLTEEAVTRLVDERLRQALAREAAAALPQGREAEQMERRRELTAFRSRVLAECERRVEEVVRDARAAAAARPSPGQGAEERPRDGREAGMSREAVVEMVRAAVAAEVAQRERTTPSADSAAALARAEVARLEQRLRHLESAQAAAGANEELQQRPNRRPRAPRADVHPMLNEHISCEAHARGGADAIVGEGASKAPEPLRHPSSSPDEVEREGHLRTPTAPPAPPTLELSRLTRDLRQELTTVLENKARQLRLDFTAAQDAVAVAQETVMLTLREEQLSLRDAVRALVTPSAVLQGLDHRLRIVREEVAALRRRLPAIDPPHPRPWAGEGAEDLCAAQGGAAWVRDPSWRGSCAHSGGEQLHGLPPAFAGDTGKGRGGGRPVPRQVRPTSLDLVNSREGSRGASAHHGLSRVSDEEGWATHAVHRAQLRPCEGQESGAPPPLDSPVSSSASVLVTELSLAAGGGGGPDGVSPHPRRPSRARPAPAIAPAVVRSVSLEDALRGERACATPSLGRIACE